MIRNNVETVVMQAFERLRFKSPIDTGNLRYNSIKIERTSPTEWRIRVDEEIAPYMHYTNEPWKKGKNPNQGWWDDAISELVEEIARELGGVKNDKHGNV